MKFFRKLVLSISIVAILLGSFGNCFGKFALVRKVYTFNDSINAGGGLLGRFVKTLVMYALLWIPVYGIASLVDLIIFNLIEFWTGSNMLGLNEYDKDGIYTKSFENGSEKVQLIYSNYGSRLDVQIYSTNGKNHSFALLKSEPGKIYELSNGTLVPVEIQEEKFQSTILIKAIKNNQLESSKLIDVKSYQELESQYSGSIY